MSSANRVFNCSVHSEKYKRFHGVKSDKGWFECIYCGDPADALDHQPPISRVDDYLSLGVKREMFLLVPCCSECNRLLGDTLTADLIDRESELKDRLSKKYKKLLLYPDWSEDEMDELGRTLRSDVRSSIKKKARIEARIDYSKGVNFFIQKYDGIAF